MSVSEDGMMGSSDSFWEIDQYKRTVKRHEDGFKLCNDLMQLIQERADLEKAYAKSLKAWSHKWSTSIEKGGEYGTMEAACKSVLSEADGVADLHLNVKEKLINEVQAQIKAWRNDNYTKKLMGPSSGTKELEDLFKKAQKPWAKRYVKAMKAKKDYHTACKLEKTATHQESNAKNDSSVSPDQLRKLQDKVEKCRRDVDTTRDKYEASLNDLNSYNAKYMEDMTEVFNRAQDYEEKRLVFFKEMMFGIHKCLDLSDSIEYRQTYQQFHHTISQADFNKDLRWWSQNHGTDMPMNWPTFEEYSPELHDIAKKHKGKGAVSTGDGITLTAISRNDPPHPASAPPPAYDNYSTTNSVNNEPPSYQSQSSQASNNNVEDLYSKPIKKKTAEPVTPTSTDETFNKPLSKDHRSSALENLADQSETSNASETVDNELVPPKRKDRKSKAAPAEQADRMTSYESSAYSNTFDSEESPVQARAPFPRPSRCRTNGGQNPFGEDDWDDCEIDESKGVPVRALYDYMGQEDDELTFKAGDIFMKLLDADEQGWCTGKKDNKTGLYPNNYVEVV